MGLFTKFKNNNNELLNIEKTNVIDGISYDEKNSKLILLLTDGMDWHNEYNHLILLQEKINNYIAYIEEKQYKKNYSNVEQIEIQIKFLFKETDKCKKFLEHVKNLINDSLINTTINIETGTKDTY